MKFSRLYALIALQLLAIAFATANAIYTALPANFLPKAISKDGAVVVGQDTNTGKAAAYAAGYMNDLPGADVGSVANSCDRHGNSIVGTSGDGKPFKWTVAGFVRLPVLAGATGGEADLISADGSTIVGLSYQPGPVNYPTEFKISGATEIKIQSYGAYRYYGYVGSTTFFTCIADDGSAVGGEACPTPDEEFNNGDVDVNQHGNYAKYEQNWIDFQVESYYDDSNDFSLTGAVEVAIQAPLLFKKTNGVWVDQAVVPDAFSTSNIHYHFFDRVNAFFNGSSYFTNEYILGITNSFNFYDSDFMTQESAYGSRDSDSGVVSFSRSSNVGTPFGQGTGFEVFASNSNGSLVYGRDSAGNPSVAVNGSVETYAAYLQANGLTQVLGTGNVIGCSTDGLVTLGYTGTGTPQYWVAAITPQVQFLGLAPDEVVGGGKGVGYAMFPTPSEPFMTVSVSSDHPLVVPNNNAHIAAGTTNAAFQFPTSAVTADTLVHVTLAMPGKSIVVPLLITHVGATMPALTLPVLTPYGAIGGHVGETCTVSFAAALPSSGALVSLRSTNPAILTVPATCFVAGGASSITFPVTVAPVNAPIGMGVVATYGTQIKTGGIWVYPAYLVSVTPSATSVIGGVGGTATAQFNGTFTAAQTLTLSSSAPTVLQVPASVPTSGPSVTFNFTTRAVDADTAVTISATCKGVTKTAVVNVRAATVLTIVPTSPSVAVNGTQVVTITLNGNCGPSGGTVTLTSATPAQVSVPASTAVVAGKTTATFVVTGKAVTTVPVNITITYKGHSFVIHATVK
jgi:hypothetical protein